MVGRNEKVIAHDAPMRLLAEYLRYLRELVGKPRYRELGTLVYLTHHALSQTVDGRNVSWDRVAQFLRALDLYQPGVLTDKHQRLARLLHSQTGRGASGAAQDEARRQFWREVDRELRAPGEAAVANRAPGVWRTTNPDRIRRLNLARRRWDVIVILEEIFDLLEDVLSDRLGGGRIVTINRAMLLEHLGVEELQRVVKAAGGSDGDCLAWTAAWQRTEPVESSGPGAERHHLAGGPPTWGSPSVVGELVRHKFRWWDSRGRRWPNGRG